MVCILGSMNAEYSQFTIHTQTTATILQKLALFGQETEEGEFSTSMWPNKN